MQCPYPTLLNSWNWSGINFAVAKGSLFNKAKSRQNQHAHWGRTKHKPSRAKRNNQIRLHTGKPALATCSYPRCHHSHDSAMIIAQHGQRIKYSISGVPLSVRRCRRQTVFLLSVHHEMCILFHRNLHQYCKPFSAAKMMQLQFQASWP